MDPTPDEPRRKALREMTGPLSILLLGVALTTGRLSQGAPLDGLSLALHLVISLSVLRLGHPLWRLLQREPRDAALVLPAGDHLKMQAGDARVSPAETFDAYLAHPDQQAGARAIPAGRSWLLSGPYAGLVFALLLAGHALVVPLLRTPLMLALLPVACGPLVLWWWRGRAARRARGGVALLLTPSQLIVRDAVGARSATWADVQAVRVESKPAWDMLRGARRAPALLIARRGSAPLVLREDELGVSARGAVAAVEGYRSAVLGSATPASSA